MTKTNTKNDTIKAEEKQPVSASKKPSKHSVVKDEETTVTAPFELGDYHKKALVKMFRCHHNKQELTYKELSAEVGVGEKTKAWQCEAWKDLKSNEYIVPASTKGKLKLSDIGVELATTLMSDEELADYKMPETNEEHHEQSSTSTLNYERM